jgi:flagellar motor switch protein FliG
MARPAESTAHKQNSDIASVIAALASRQADHGTRRKLTGPERAAVLMLALGQQYGANIWSQLDDDELREISIVMSTLGTIDAGAVEDLLLEFVSRMSASGALMGNYDATERLLHQYLPPERVNGIMDEIRGPAGRNMWEKLSNVQEGVLANYLKNEYPQTIAVVLSKLRPEHAARVLAILPEELALDVVNRMLKMEAVQKEVIERVEQTLRTEFMSNLSQTRRRDAHEVMAEIFNNFDRQTETRFMTSLEDDNRESAERIKALMFTFDDLIRLDTGSAQTRTSSPWRSRAPASRCASSSCPTCRRARPRCWSTTCRPWARSGCGRSTRPSRSSSTWPRTWPPRARSRSPRVAVTRS